VAPDALRDQAMQHPIDSSVLQIVSLASPMPAFRPRRLS